LAQAVERAFLGRTCQCLTGAGASAMASYSLAEVAKHTSKDDCWVVLDGKVLNVTSFLKDHPGGELAILTFAGKDATAEFNMIHPPDVVSKYAPDTVIGTVEGSAGGAPAAAVAAVPAAASGGVVAPAPIDKGDLPQSHWFKAEDNCTGGHYGPFILSVSNIVYRLVGAAGISVREFMSNICKTIVPCPSLDAATTKSASWLMCWFVVGAYVHMTYFFGPDTYNATLHLFSTILGRFTAWSAMSLAELYTLAAALIYTVAGLINHYNGTSVADLKKNKGKWVFPLTGMWVAYALHGYFFKWRFQEMPVWYLKHGGALHADAGIIGDVKFFFRTWSFFNGFGSSAKPHDMTGVTAVTDWYKVTLELLQDGWFNFYVFVTICLCCWHLVKRWCWFVDSGTYKVRSDFRPWVKFLGLVLFVFVTVLWTFVLLYIYFAPRTATHTLDGKPYYEHVKIWSGYAGDGETYTGYTSGTGAYHPHD